jgi:hypothetical protein
VTVPVAAPAVHRTDCPSLSRERPTAEMPVCARRGIRLTRAGAKAEARLRSVRVACASAGAELLSLPLQSAECSLASWLDTSLVSGQTDGASWRHDLSPSGVGRCSRPGLRPTDAPCTTVPRGPGESPKSSAPPLTRPRLARWESGARSCSVSLALGNSRLRFDRNSFSSIQLRGHSPKSLRWGAYPESWRRTSRTVAESCVIRSIAVFRVSARSVARRIRCSFSRLARFRAVSV